MITIKIDPSIHTDSLEESFLNLREAIYLNEGGKDNWKIDCDYPFAKAVAFHHSLRDKDLVSKLSPCGGTFEVGGIQLEYEPLKDWREMSRRPTIKVFNFPEEEPYVAVQKED